MSLSVQERIDLLKKGVLSEIQKKKGKDAVYVGEDEIKPVEIVCPSGSIALDLALGVGGIPKGRIIEISGQESCGKSTLTELMIAECQRNGKLCAYLDVEQAFDPTYAHKLGIDTSNLIFSQPTTMEDTFEILHDLINSGMIDYIVVDSTNAMLIKRIMEGDVGESNMGRSGLIMSQELPKVNVECANTGCTVIFISQIRSKVGQIFGSPDVIGVGNAMKFYATIRIKVSKSDIVKSEEVGQQSIDITALCFKNKVAPPYKNATFTLLTGKDGLYGIDTFKEIIDFALKFEIIKQAGAWYSFTLDEQEQKFQGRDKMVDFLQSNIAVFSKIKEDVQKHLRDSNPLIQKSIEGSFDDLKNKTLSERKKKKVRELPKEPEAKEESN